MPNGTELAVTQAARLNEIGFPEFTAKLITDTFDALIAANIRQTEAYIELVEQVGKTLTTYINDTKDDISGEDILQFLANVLPPGDPQGSEPTKVLQGASLGGNADRTKSDVAKLNDALTVTEVTEPLPENKPFSTADETSESGVTLTEETYNTVLMAVANRLAANKYELLTEMVKLGILRLVVENGTIETRLTFTTYGSTFYQRQATRYHRDSFRFKAKARTGAFVSLWAKASASTRYCSVNVSTTRETNRDISGSKVQIYGSVVINFKTDYQPLAA